MRYNILTWKRFLAGEKSKIRSVFRRTNLSRLFLTTSIHYQCRNMSKFNNFSISYLFLRLELGGLLVDIRTSSRLLWAFPGSKKITLDFSATFFRCFVQEAKQFDHEEQKIKCKSIARSIAKKVTPQLLHVQIAMVRLLGWINLVFCILINCHPKHKLFTCVWFDLNYECVTLCYWWKN